MAEHDVQHDASIIIHTKDSSVANHVDRDDEVAAYAGGDAAHIDEETNKQLFWTINKRILACMLGTYFCQSLDKGTLGFASVMNIKQDANLQGQDYSWLGTILYMGVLVGEYPTNLLLQRFPVAKYLSINVFLWGAVICCSAASHNFGSLMAVRFLLGVFESCVQPAFIIMTSMWYTKNEQSILTSLWYCMTGVQLMVGGLIAYGASHYQGHSLKSWQLLFLVLGCATCAWAVFIGWWLPDSPMKAKCFNEDQKRMMIERVRANETGIQNKTYKRYQMLEAIKDPVIWCYVMLQVTSTLVIGGLGVFSNLVIASFGFTYLQTQLLNIAQGAVTIIVMIGGAWLVTWTKQTALVMHVWTLPAIVGTAVIYAIPPNPGNKVGLLIAFYCTQFYLAEGNMIFSLISRNVAGQTKKSTTLAMTFIGWAAGNMAAPQIFQDSDAPRYQKGFTAHFCLYVLFNMFLILLRILLAKQNAVKRRNASAAVASDHDANTYNDEKISHSHAFDDLTDKENPDFRYEL
ncbi:putative MFS transporter [Hypoxylon fuscum]|nr:putative MFS transporter [Hypoxylon fuscum]